MQPSVILPFLLIVWVMLIAFRIGAYLDAKAKKNSPKPVETELPKKVCPMHSWKWEEQPGMENVTYMWCTTCGKTPRQVSESP